MKKALIIILFFTSLLFWNLKPTFSFTLIGNNGSGFYTSIADTIEELEKDLYTIDFGGKTGTKDKINKLLGTGECLKENLTEEEIENIVHSGSLKEEVFEKIKDECKDEKKEYVPNGLIINIVNAVKKVHNDTQTQSKDKISQNLSNIFTLGNHGIYADGIPGNAPFDLITDLQDIDNIMFSKIEDDEMKTSQAQVREDQKAYLRPNEFSLPDALSGTLQKLISTSKKVNSKNGGGAGDEIWENYWKAPFKQKSDYLKENKKNEEYKQVDDNKVWTSYAANSNAKFKYYSVGDKYSSAGINLAGNYLSIDDKGKKTECKEVFCIDQVSMKYKFEDEFFGGDSFYRGGNTRDMSIEDLIIRSNDHLRKFTNTSLIQAKMTINNFELGLYAEGGLDLTKMFHLGVQVVKKPVPILDLTYETQKNNSGRLVNGSGANISQFELNKQLEFYYKTYGLDYTRRNDLSLFTQIENDKQNALNSTELSVIGSPGGYESKASGYREYMQRLASERNLFQEMVRMEAANGMLKNLERQFREIEIYNRTIKDYIVDLKTLIKNLLNIPVDSNMT